MAWTSDGRYDRAAGAQENLSPQTPGLKVLEANSECTGSATAAIQKRLMSAEQLLGGCSEMPLRALVQLSPETEAAHTHPPVRRTVSSVRSSCSTELFLAGASPFEVRVMGIDCLKTKVRWYRVRLICRHRPGSAWEVMRRFSEFDMLLRRIMNEGEDLPPLPCKMPSLLLSPTEQQKRIIGLQHFSEAVLANPLLLAMPVVSRFFDLDFGLWHATSSLSPMIDRGAQRAARMIQAEARRWLRGRHMPRWATAAKACTFNGLDKENRAVGNRLGASTDFLALTAQAAGAIFAPKKGKSGSRAALQPWN